MDGGGRKGNSNGGGRLREKAGGWRERAATQRADRAGVWRSFRETLSSRGWRLWERRAGAWRRAAACRPAALRASLDDNRGWSQSAGLESPCHVAWIFPALSARRKPDAQEGAARLRGDEARARGRGDPDAEAPGVHDRGQAADESLRAEGRRGDERSGAWTHERAGLWGDNETLVIGVRQVDHASKPSTPRAP